MEPRTPFALTLTGTLATTALVALAGCGRSAPPPPRGPVEVGVETIHASRVVLTTELPGRTAAYLVAEVRPQVNGIIQKRLFQEGSEVAADSLLYQIDPAPYQAAYDQAKAALAVADANLPATRLRAERLKGLVEIHAVGQQDYDDAAAALLRAQASVDSARAAVESARINLSYTPLRAPISGRIGKSSVTVGALVTAYQPTPLAVIQKLDPIYVDVTQASADVLRLRRNLESGRLRHGGETESRVSLLLEDGTPYPREGRLQFRDVTVDPTTGSVVLRMVFPNPDATLLPGMYVRAVVEEGVNEKAVLAPQQGITRDLKGSAVALVVGTDGKVQQRLLTVDRAIGDRWLVTDGLGEGDRVIVEGLLKIRPGMPVKPVPAARPPAAGGGPAPATQAAAAK
ncbi:MAG TPA: efflux RND transporter periplasmic adaptor subunit [Vicinamibacteria bacterium]|nr:efflux RND transporter periplasmic adaptor subunit [Vicinamibacteria bacterium]